MTRLSVNLNKIALIRNARGGNLPDLVQIAKDCEAFGAQGITVHPRPDERHVRISDLPLLKEVVTTEFNIEGNPTPKFVDFVIANRPHQVTLVPDAPSALTSDAGWDTVGEYDFLRKITAKFQEIGIRVSIFVDPVAEIVKGAKRIGVDRIELYTGDFAKNYTTDPEMAIAPFVEAAIVANDLEIDINAGHDLNLHNLAYFNKHIPKLKEVSIGHALISDALYFGLQNTIQMYLARLK